MICVCAPLFCRRSLLVGTNRSAVDHLDVAVVCSGDGVHHPIPYTRLPPPHEAVVAGSARAKPLWQITPRRAGSQHPKNAVQHAAIIDARHSARLVGQKRRDHAPFEVGQAISAHAYADATPIPFMGSRLVGRADGLEPPPAREGSGRSVLVLATAPHQGDKKERTEPTAVANKLPSVLSTVFN